MIGALDGIGLKPSHLLYNYPRNENMKKVFNFRGKGKSKITASILKNTQSKGFDDVIKVKGTNYHGDDFFDFVCTPNEAVFIAVALLKAFMEWDLRRGVRGG